MGERDEGREKRETQIVKSEIAVTASWRRNQL